MPSDRCFVTRRMHNIECRYWIWSFGIFPAVGLWLGSSSALLGILFCTQGAGRCQPLTPPWVWWSPLSLPWWHTEVRDPPQTSPRWDRDFPTPFPWDFLLEEEMNGWVLLKAQLPQQHLAGCKVFLVIYCPQCFRQTKYAGSLSWLTLQTLSGALHKRGTSLVCRHPGAPWEVTGNSSAGRFCPRLKSKC